MTTKRDPRRRQRGFTLVEIMVVVMILGLLATMVASNVTHTSDEARLQKAATDVRLLADAVRMHYVNHSRLPTLAQLAQADERGRRAIEDLPQDPWKGDYVLQPGSLPGDFVVVSAGPNGTLGDDDDIPSRRETR